MAINVDLPPELERLYRDEAAKRNMTVEDLMIQVIQEELDKTNQVENEQLSPDDHGDS